MNDEMTSKKMQMQWVDVLNLLEEDTTIQWRETFIKATIRGTKKVNDSFYLWCCPVTAACYLKKDKIYSTDDWLKAAHEMGLSEADGNVLVMAADNEEPVLPEEDPTPLDREVVELWDDSVVKRLEALTQR